MVPDSSPSSATEDAAEPGQSCWTEREAELLTVTLRLLQSHGYDRLTVDAVAAEAKASKATVYRRWPSKADLVLAAFIEAPGRPRSRRRPEACVTTSSRSGPGWPRWPGNTR